MKYIKLALGILASVRCFACGIDYPLEYLSHESPIIIVGEIEKMDYDISREPPEQEYHYSLAYVRVKEVIKSDIQINEGDFFTFKVESKKDGGTSASIYWDKGMSGTWLFMRYESSSWLYPYLRPEEARVDIKRELSFTKKRSFGASFTVRNDRVDRLWWPKNWGEDTPLKNLILWVNQMAVESGELQYQYPEKPPIQVKIVLGENVAPLLSVQKIDLDTQIETILEKIRAQHPNLDFEYLKDTILIFNRTMAEQVELSNG